VLKTLHIRGYQSIDQLHIDLGQFTVITGPSGSGKSAVYRALRTLATNQPRGTAVITRGRSTFALGVMEEGARLIVSLARGGGNASGKYEVAVDGVPSVFTKLDGRVPEAVGRLLALGTSEDGKVQLSFAHQFDPPFLLTSPGAQVARVLGELTGSDRLYSAAREANRLRVQSQREAEAARDQSARLVTALSGFATVPADLKLVAEAEAALERARGLESRVSALQELLSRVQVAGTVLAQAEAEAPPEVDLSGVEECHGKVLDLEALLAGAEAAGDIVAVEAEGEAEALGQVQAAEDLVRQALEEAGVCPTCGQVVGRVHAH
jgi:exonuclease SbcC